MSNIFTQTVQNRHKRLLYVLSNDFNLLSSPANALHPETELIHYENQCNHIRIAIKECGLGIMGDGFGFDVALCHFSNLFIFGVQCCRAVSNRSAQNLTISLDDLPIRF